MRVFARLLLMASLLIALSPAPIQAEGLLVFAASSLRDPFTRIGELFAQKTGQKIRFNFAGSQVLRAQIEFGAVMGQGDAGRRWEFLAGKLPRDALDHRMIIPMM